MNRTKSTPAEPNVKNKRKEAAIPVRADGEGFNLAEPTAPFGRVTISQTYADATRLYTWPFSSGQSTLPYERGDSSPSPAHSLENQRGKRSPAATPADVRGFIAGNSGNSWLCRPEIARSSGRRTRNGPKRRPRCRPVVGMVPVFGDEFSSNMLGRSSPICRPDLSHCLGVSPITFGQAHTRSRECVGLVHG